MALVTDTSTLPPAVGGGASRTTLGRIDKNYEDFLKLLTTQLQNQDPSDPTDTNQLTQQIATLSQVEQQLNTNKNLETLIGMYQATQYNSIVSYIGKQIEAEGDVGSLEKVRANFGYTLAEDAEAITVTIRDSDGNIVRTDTTASKTAGENRYVWDGKDNSGHLLPAGSYSISVAATNAQQQAITTTLTTETAALAEARARYVYYLAGEASQVSITIKDKTGAVVRTDTVSGTKFAGRNEYTWDGKDNNGNTMEEGTYKITVSAKDLAGQDLTARTFITGIVTSIDSVDGVAYLSIGDLSIPLQNVTSIRLAGQHT
jgi:flagellar basal-body rod modification protein FlgD